MDWFIYAVCAAGGYLIGNIQTAVLLSNFKYKSDIRSLGSGNAGATNMLRVFGLRSGVITFIGDLIKAVLAILLSWAIGGENREICGYVTALSVVLGHNFPVFFGFHGGKGVACSLAIIWMLTPFPEALAASAAAFILILLTRIISLSSLLAMALYVALVVALNSSNAPLIALAAVLFLIMLLRHIENIKRLFNGTEGRVSFTKNNKAPDTETEVQSDQK